MSPLYYWQCASWSITAYQSPSYFQSELHSSHKSTLFFQIPILTTAYHNYFTPFIHLTSGMIFSIPASLKARAGFSSLQGLPGVSPERWGSSGVLLLGPSNNLPKVLGLWGLWPKTATITPTHQKDTREEQGPPDLSVQGEAMEKTVLGDTEGT